MSLQIGQAIYDILTSTASITNVLQKRIFALIADNTVSYPFIVYKRSGCTPASTKDSYYNYDHTVELIVCTDNYTDSASIAELVVSSLEHKNGTYNNIKIDDIQLIDADEDFIDDCFTQKLIFKIQEK